jgi:hypothetical protein
MMSLIDRAADRVVGELIGCPLAVVPDGIVGRVDRAVLVGFTGEPTGGRECDFAGSIR